MQTTLLHQHNDIETSIWQAISRSDKFQQMKLLEFINSLFLNEKQKNNNKLLKYAGCIEKDELKLMTAAIADCEKIDDNEC